MLPQKKYTGIYSSYDNYGNLLLLLCNDESKESLFFDGFNFTYNSSFRIPSPDFKKIRDKDVPFGIYEIEEIKQIDDVTFIRFSNGNIFQIHTIPQGYRGFIQVLSVFEKIRDSLISTPFGVSFYEAVLLNMEKAEDCNIEIEESK